MPAPLLMALIVTITTLGCAERLQAPAYFPRGEFDEFVESWYSTQLAALDEPSLLHAPDTEEVIRFTWLRSFHQPVVVRVVFGTDDATLVFKRGDGSGGWDPGRLVENRQHRLSGNDMSAARAIADFLARCEGPPEELGFDGAEWIFEYRYGDRYCLVDEWSPNSGPWREAGMALISLAGYRPPADDVY